MLATGSVVTSATAVRVSTRYLELLVERTPPLARLAVTASVGGAGARKAQAAFRDYFIAVARESADLAWREMRRAVDELDAFTRADEAPDVQPRRPQRVKR